MTKKKISVERNIEHADGDNQYKGYVDIAGTRLDYEIVFMFPISNFQIIDTDTMDENEIRKLITITVKRGCANIELTMDEYYFFFSMLVGLAVDLYNSQQTNTTRSEIYDFPLGLCEMLSAPKFGCALVAA